MKSYKYTFYLLFAAIIFVTTIILFKNNVDWCLIYSQPTEKDQLGISEDLIIHLDMDYQDWQLVYTEPIFNYCTLEPSVLAFKAKITTHTVLGNKAIKDITFKIFSEGLSRDIGILDLDQVEAKDPNNACRFNIKLAYNDGEDDKYESCNRIVINANNTVELKTHFHNDGIFNFLGQHFFQIGIRIPPKICNIKFIDV